MKKWIVFDIETDSLDPLNPQLVGFASKLVDNTNSPIFYYSANELTSLRHIFESSDWIKVCHNIKFEMSYLKSLDINMCRPFVDTMIMAWVLNMGVERTDDVASYKLKDLEKLWLGVEREDFKALSKRFAVSVPTKRIKKDGTSCMRKRNAFASEIPESELAPYCKADVEGTFKLYELMKEKMTETDWKIHDREMKLITIYEDMERNGVLMDKAYLQKYEGVITAKLQSIADKVGTKLNLASPKQLCRYLYKDLQLPVLYKTGKGEPSTGKWAIKKLIRECPEHREILKDTLEYRTWRKYRDTYVRSWIESIHPSDGRVHFSINPIGAHSGRISSRSQQIPKRTANAGDVRKAIIARPGYKLCEFDFSQIEPRIMAHFTNDPKLLDIFNSGKDIYKYVAGAVLNIPPDRITKEQRDTGKVLVLAINYGETEWGLADNLDISVEEARGFLNNYFIEFSHVKIYQREVIEKAKKQGYIETIDGVRRKIPSAIALPPKWTKKNGRFTDTNKWIRAAAERKALNLPIQGSAADAIKKAMIAIHPRLHPSIKMLLQIHDSLLFEIPDDKVKTAVPAIRQTMETIIKLKVPTPVSVSIGRNLKDMEES